MTIVVYLGNFTKGLVRKKIRQVIPYALVFIGILFVLRGLGLGIPYLSPIPMNHLETVTTQSCH